MFAGNWRKKRSQRSRVRKHHQPLEKGRRRKQGACDRSLRMEALEDRRVLATFVVNTTADLDQNDQVTVGSLRQAINLSNASPNEFDTIVFADVLFDVDGDGLGNTVNIALNGGELNITDEVQILGPGSAALEITQTTANSRIFNIDGIGAEDFFGGVTIGGVTLRGGNLTGNANEDVNRGGAILNRERLTLIEVVVSGNSASQGGGGIFVPIGSLDVDRSLIGGALFSGDGNSSGGGGGGILLGMPDQTELLPTVNISSSTISGNNTFGTGAGDDFRPGYGGGVFNRNGDLNISSATITNNTATTLGGGVASFGNQRPEGLIDPLLAPGGQVFSLVNNDFETPSVDEMTGLPTFIPAGLPAEFGVWQGDLARIVPAPDGIVANRGTSLLEFAATSTTGFEPAAPEQPDTLSEVWQLIDISAYQTLFPDDALPPDEPPMDPPTESPEIPTLEIEFQALFNRIAGDEMTDTEFQISVQLHDGDPAEFDPAAPILASLPPGAPFESDSDPETWELQSSTFQISNQAFGDAGLIIPTDFDITTAYLAVRLAAVENVTDDELPPDPNDPLDPMAPVAAPPEIEFGGHFVDSANLVIRVVPGPDLGDIPQQTVSTIVDHTILFNNGGTDIDNVGTTGGDEPLPLLLSIRSNGDNLVGTGNVVAGPEILGNPTLVTPLIQSVTVFTEPENILDEDPLLSDLVDVGGSTLTYHPLAGSPVIDASQGLNGDFFEQRGRHFTRFFGAAQDIGAVEVQAGSFVVDTLEDERDNQFTSVFETFDLSGPIVTTFDYTNTGGTFTINGVPIGFDGDFSLREALDFSERNPLPDTITFQPGAFPDLLLQLEDPTPSGAPTIQVNITDIADSAFLITRSVSIIGPESFDLEIDVSGTDITPDLQDNQGSRLFEIDDNDDLTFAEVVISNLTLTGGDVGGDGGSILNAENLTITGSRIKDNAASSEGGGIFTATGELILDSSALFDNSSNGPGGALFVEAGFAANPEPTRVTVRNSTISGNTSDFQGAGIFNSDGEVVIEYSTITANSSPYAAGVANRPGSFDTVTLVRSSIIAGNVGGDDVTALQGATNFVSANFNLIGNGNATSFFALPGDSVNVSNSDLRLAPLADIGGFTFVHSLLPGSPAIDAGNSFAAAGVGGVPLFDQRGELFQRVVDGLQNSQARIDIGAFELQPITFTVSTLLDENDGVISVGSLSLREAIELSNANPLPDTITFDPVLFATGDATISQSAANGFFLQPGTPTDIRITDSVEILGPGSSLLFLDGSGGFVDILGLDPNSTRFFTIDDGNQSSEIEVVIRDLTFTNSTNTADDGGAVWSSENLLLAGVEFEDNLTSDLQLLGTGLRGGALFQQGGELTLDGVEFSGNQTEGVASGGGALFVLDSTLNVLPGTAFFGNSTQQSDSGGAAIFAQNSNVTIEESFLTGNLTAAGDSRGAAIYALASDVQLNSVFVSSNRTLGAQSRGAGVYTSNSQLTVTDSTITLNNSVGTFAAGAGIFSAGGTLNVTDSLLDRNSTNGAGSGGGAIAGSGAEIVVERTTLIGNSTNGLSAPGGGLHNLNGNLTIRDSTLTGNEAQDEAAQGGAVFSSTNLSNLRTAVINSTLSGNTAGGQGGGVFNANGLTEILYSTITDNSLTGLVTPFGFGSGVASLGGSSTTRTEVGSSIIAGNGGVNASDVDNPGAPFGDKESGFLSLGFNVIGTGLSVGTNTAAGAFNGPGDFQPGTDQTNVIDPLLAPLADNNGPTQTHALQENSPAIDAGNPAARSGVGDVPSQDQNGLLRVQGPQIDVGAFESAAPADFNADGSINGADFLAWQRGFGTAAADRADGDANQDNQVDSTDLSLWEADFGDPPLALAAVAVFDSSEPVAATIENSEPLQAAAVSTVSPLLGLTFYKESQSSQPFVEVSESVENLEESRVAKDDLFATFLPTSGAGEFEALATESQAQEGVSGFEVTVEDHIFELLGTDA